MSKDKNAANGDEADDKQQEEFVIVEVDSNGKPLAEAADHDTGDEDEDLNEDESEAGAEDEERLGHDESDDEGTLAGETPDEKRERRRRENRTKRIRNRVAAEAKDRLIENQGRMLLSLQEQVAKLQGRTVQYDVNLLQSQLAQVEAQQTDAKAVLAKLHKAGDGEGIAEVVEMQMNLRDQHRQIVEQLRRAKASGPRKGPADAAEDAEAPAQPTARRTPAPDPEILRRAQDWAARNKWANPRSGDPEEIQIIRAIDQNLANEGWDPRSNDYWAELTSRVRRRLPHHFKKAASNGDGRGESRVSNGNGARRPAQGGPRMAPASQSNGGSRPLGRNEVRVTPERKQAMQEAGMWDDPAKRNRMLAQYAKFDRENAA